MVPDCWERMLLLRVLRIASFPLREELVPLLTPVGKTTVDI